MRIQSICTNIWWLSKAFVEGLVLSTGERKLGKTLGSFSSGEGAGLQEVT
jgi:hypothetical protein